MNRPRFPSTQVDYFAAEGGLDLVTPAIALKAGRVIDAKNYEPLTVGGYRRINGYERVDGQPSPTSATYWVIGITLTGTLTTGATVTGATSGATGRVLASDTTSLVLGRVVGTFVSGEALQVTGVTQATATSAANQGAGSTSALDAAYRLLAANDRRADIQPVPGSGDVRGVFVLNDVIYAFRDNGGATASLLYKSSSTGWQAVSLGREMLVGVRTATVTVSIAAPGVVTWTGNKLADGQTVALTTTGALPTGLTAGVNYFLVNTAANTFQLATTAGGTPIVTTGTQSGVHTAKLTSGVGFNAGDVVTGATSGATATVKAALLRTGTWQVDPVGSLVFASVTGAFVSGEALQVLSATVGQSTSADTAITRLPGGRLEVVKGNFSGSTTTRKAYGVDGVNPGFEFDGTTYVPIHTGQASDTPSHVEVHKNKLFFAFNSKVEFSATNNPYSWSALTGAAEIGLGSTVTALASQTGNATASSLAIFTTGKTSVLYGSSAGDFQLITSVYELGYSANTVQSVSNNTYGLSARGVQALVTTLNYGDFSFDAVSFNVQPLIQTKYSLATASITLRGKNQYRLYFSDGTGLIFGLTGEKLSGIMPLDYGRAVKCVWNSMWADGSEHTYFGSTDGYLYEDNVGTSFDGAAIEAWCRVAFNAVRSPRVIKRFRSAVFEMVCEGYASVMLGYDLGYATPDVAPQQAVTQTMAGAGMYWDAVGVTWDRFTWDAAVVTEPRISIDGAETNIGFSVYSSSAQDDPIVLQGVNLLYTPRHVAR